MVARLRTYGAHSEEVPTISVEPPRSPLQMDKAIRGLVEGRYEWVAFTSVNAVKAVREKFEEYGLDARAFSGLKVAAVGEVTAQALQDWGIEPDLVPERRAVGGRAGGGVPAVRRRARPDQPGVPAAGRHRHRDPGRRSGPARLGGRGRHRVPDRPGGAAGRLGARGDQDRQVRRGRVHVVLDRAQPGRHRRQAAPVHDHRGDRPGRRRRPARSTACGSTWSPPSRRWSIWPTRWPASPPSVATPWSRRASRCSSRRSARPSPRRRRVIIGRGGCRA